MKFLALPVFILFFCATTPLNAQHLEQMSKQLYQPADFKKDIDLVQTTLEKEHPNLYLYISKKKLDYKFDSLRKTVIKPLTPIALYVKLLHVISSIGDGHLTVELDYSKLLRFFQTYPRYKAIFETGSVGSLDLKENGSKRFT